MEPADLPAVPAWMITTAAELHGYRVVSSFGVVTGIAVRRYDFVFKAPLEDVFARTREQAFAQMALQAAERGANAIIAMSYDSLENRNGLTEVVAYGTAVVVEPAQG
jgi:uncharacterized protein YbjQ (UPF0145 family)